MFAGTRASPAPRRVLRSSFPPGLSLANMSLGSRHGRGPSSAASKVLTPATAGGGRVDYPLHPHTENPPDDAHATSRLDILLVGIFLEDARLRVIDRPAWEASIRECKVAHTRRTPVPGDLLAAGPAARVRSATLRRFGRCCSPPSRARVSWGSWPRRRQAWPQAEEWNVEAGW